MKSRIPVQSGSLFYAPMEGVTDTAYRMCVQELYPEWDLLFTDFLRLPAEGVFSQAKIKEHMGETVLNSPRLKAKTIFQILAAVDSNIEANLEQIVNLGIDKLDLNLGCPSKRVNSHGGGAYLLSDHESLKNVLSRIRKNFEGHFSVKMRIGFRNDHNFLDTLKLIEDCGVEAITLHARTRDQLYQGRADWKYIKQAVEAVSVPLIGNGDIWTLQEVEQCFEETGCYAIMCGRSAMKTPWLASMWQEYKGRIHMVSDELLLKERASQLDVYFHYLEKHYRQYQMPEESILKRFKGLCQYLFLDYLDADKVRSLFLRSRSLEEFKANMESLQGTKVYAQL